MLSRVDAKSLPAPLFLTFCYFGALNDDRINELMEVVMVCTIIKLSLSWHNNWNLLKNPWKNFNSKIYTPFSSINCCLTIQKFTQRFLLWITDISTKLCVHADHWNWNWKWASELEGKKMLKWVDDFN